MTATATIDGTAASTGRLPSVASGVLELIWPLYLTLVFTLGAWVLVPTVVLGWQPITIISGSMAPTVQPGHVVVVEPYRGQELVPGAVVTYRDAEVDRLVTHRIVSVGEDGTYTTRGDANGVDDRLPLTPDRIVGVGRLVVPAAGLPALWSHEGRTHLLAGLGLLTVLATTAAAGAASEAARSIRRRLRDRPRRPGSVRPVVLGTGVVAIVAVLGATAVSRAAFVGAEDNATNTFDARTLATPTDLTAEGACLLVLGTGVQLTWTGTGADVQYEVERSTSETGPFELRGTTTDISYADAALEGTTYHYRIRSVAGTWVSGWTPTTSATAPLLCT